MAIVYTNFYHCLNNSVSYNVQVELQTPWSTLRFSYGGFSINDQK